jgi:DNA invertase Pin-like site-specific DNA recombinase
LIGVGFLCAEITLKKGRTNDCRILPCQHGRPIARRSTRQPQAASTERIFSEKVSGARSDRRQLAKTIASLGPGDLLLNTRLDRFARSTRDLLNVLAAISDAGASFKSLNDYWADTTTPHGRLMLAVLGGLAEFERSLILARTTEGRKRALARGVRFGRKPKLTPFQMKEALARREARETLADIGRSYGVSHSTISRL